MAAWVGGQIELLAVHPDRLALSVAQRLQPFTDFIGSGLIALQGTFTARPLAAERRLIDAFPRFAKPGPIRNGIQFCFLPFLLKAPLPLLSVSFITRSGGFRGDYC